MSTVKFTYPFGQPEYNFAEIEGEAEADVRGNITVSLRDYKPDPSRLQEIPAHTRLADQIVLWLHQKMPVEIAGAIADAVDGEIRRVAEDARGRDEK